MPIADVSLALIPSVWFSVFAALIISTFRFRKAPIGEKPSIKNIILTLLLTMLATLIITTCIYWLVVDWMIGILMGLFMPFIMLPLSIIILVLLYINRSSYMAAFLGLALLTPNIYATTVYLKVNGLTKWLESAWSKMPFCFEIFSSYFLKVLTLAVSSTGEMNTNNFSFPVTLKAGLIHIIFWAVIVFGLQAILKYTKKERE